MTSLNHMTHHSLPQQMVSMPFSQPPQQQQSIFQPSSQLAAQHSAPPARHSVAAPPAQDKQCVRERSDSAQSVEAMVCDEDEEIIRPSEEPVRSAWSEQVISGFVDFHVSSVSTGPHIFLPYLFLHIPSPTLARYQKFDITLVSWQKSCNRVTKSSPKSQHFH